MVVVLKCTIMLVLEILLLMPSFTQSMSEENSCFDVVVQGLMSEKNLKPTSNS